MRADCITRGLRAALLEALTEGPPAHAGERWFGDDLGYFTFDELQQERQRLRLRLLLTPRPERDYWPSTWLADRLARVEELLAAERGATAWAKVRR